MRTFVFSFAVCFAALCAPMSNAQQPNEDVLGHVATPAGNVIPRTAAVAKKLRSNNDADPKQINHATTTAPNSGEDMTPVNGYLNTEQALSAMFGDRPTGLSPFVELTPSSRKQWISTNPFTGFQTNANFGAASPPPAFAVPSEKLELRLDDQKDRPSVLVTIKQFTKE